MTPHMITKKDIKALQIYETPLGKIVNWAVILAPIFLTILCIFNLYLASKIGNNAGYDFISLLKTWIKGVNVNNDYSGFVIAAMERLEASMLQLSFAIIFAILAYAYHKRRKMDLRILETLKSKDLL